MAADLLQRHLGIQLVQYFRDEFAQANEPTSLHRAVASIPFALAVTTNYDRLLEKAYRVTPPVFTWRDPGAFLSSIKNRDFSIIKTHGDVFIPESLVLTRSQYRDLIHLNDAFNACLRNLFMSHTFLFIGYSLRDHDILGLMDQLRIVFGQGFGPHYAILFEDEVDDRFIDFLRESCGVETIVCPLPSSDTASGSGSKDGRASGDCNCCATPICNREKAFAAASLLREISGRVSVEQLATVQGYTRFDELFSKRVSCCHLLKTAVELTGSLRGDLCLMNGDYQKVIYKNAIHPPLPQECNLIATFDNQTNLHRVRHTSVIGSLFLQHNIVDSTDIEESIEDTQSRVPHVVYIPDVCHADTYLTAQGMPGTIYEACHPDVRSELACPIYSDGQRIGVLNVESDRVAAFTADHAVALTEIAKRIGWVHHEARMRMRAAEKMERYFKDPSLFSSLMAVSRLLKKLELRYLIWSIDSIQGKMVPHYDENQLKIKADENNGEPIEYRFEERSLATLVLRERRRIVILDAEEEVSRGEKSRLAQVGVKRFDIHGPVVGLPIRAFGHTAAVLIAWSASSKAGVARAEFHRVPERIRRMAHLIANDVTDHEGRSRAEQFLTLVNVGLDNIEITKEWSQQSRDPLFREKFIDMCLRALLSPAVGLRRVRLWLRRSRTKQPARYLCVRSITNEDATYRNKLPENAYAGVYSEVDDPYVSYTLTRFRSDPYARVQQQEMFGEPDKNHETLNKADGGEWLVAPIIVHGHSRGTKLSGFISADSHYFDQTKQCMRHDQTSDAERTFQRYAMDLITDVLDLITAHERDRDEIPPHPVVVASADVIVQSTGLASPKRTRRKK